MADMQLALAALQDHWGFNKFKPAQEQVISAALAGRDVLAVLPTGYGKSATFQIPAIITEGTAIVVSPLIALMKDQCDDCLKKGIKASFVNSHVSDKEIQQRFSDLAAGAFKIFYIAPERLASKSFCETIQLTNVSYIVVDEAHCVSRWGHDFRPAYLKIKTLVKLCSNGERRPPLIAVTATATKDIESDIMLGCGVEGDDYERFVGDPIRPNFAYKVLEGNPWFNLKSQIMKFDPVSGRYVIYCGTRKGSEKVAMMVEEILGRHQDGSPIVGFYHAGMTKDERTKAQNAFKSGQISVVVATCAFGMGIDIPNIRAVVHFGIPGSIEDYCQESGRAGRDGLHADVVLVHDEYSVNLRQMFIDNANPPYSIYERLWSWLHDELKAGEMLMASGADIAASINRSARAEVCNASQVLGCLSTMDAYGLVNRRYAQGGLSLRIDRAALTAFLKSPVSNPLLKKTAEYLLDDVLPAFAGSNQSSVSLVVDLTTAAECIDMAEPTFRKMCEVLEDKNVLEVERSFHGKSTQIVKYDSALAETLPRELIEAKREREQARLEYMLGYVNAKNRVQYIKDYFLSK